MSPSTCSKHKLIKFVYNHRAKRNFKTKITLLLESDKEYNKEKKTFLRIRKLKQKIQPVKVTNENSSNENTSSVLNNISTENNNKMTHQEVLDKILSENPEMNIISRKGKYLVRVKVKSSNYMERFDTLQEAKKMRNKMLLLSMQDDPKYYCHMMRRLAISKNNKLK